MSSGFKKAIAFPFMLMSFCATGSLAEEIKVPGLTEMSVDCVIHPSKVSDLGVISSGIIQSVAVDRSDTVKKGQVLAVLNNSAEQAALDLAKERYQATKTEIELRKASVALAERQYQRSLDAFKGDALSKHDLDVSETELQLAKIQLLQARSKQAIEYKELQRAEVMLERKTILSPFSGIVMEQFKTEGEYLNEEPVLRIAQLHPLHIEVILASEFFGKVKPGMKASVSPVAIGNADALEAEVTRVDKVIDAASSTYGIRLELANPELEITAGTQCKLQFEKEPS